MRMIAETLTRLSALISALTSAICVVIIYVMLGLLAAQVFLRYFFGAPPSWTEEVAITLFAWLVLLYATVGVSERFHVAIDFLPVGARRLRAISDRIVGLAIFGFGGVLFWAGWAYVQRTSGQRSAALQTPIEALYAAAPVGGALLAFHALAMIVSPCTSSPPATPPIAPLPQPPLPQPRLPQPALTDTPDRAATGKEPATDTMTAPTRPDQERGR